MNAERLTDVIQLANEIETIKHDLQRATKKAKALGLLATASVLEIADNSVQRAFNFTTETAQRHEIKT